MIDTIRHHALADSPDEPGAAERRLQVEEIDRDLGSAVAYVAKYIAKNVDGYGLQADEFAEDAATASERVRTWASTWGIRQFQDFGGPPVTVWRELRRLHSPVHTCAPLEQARLAADQPDWAAFIEAMGGVCVSRQARSIGLAKAWSDRPDSYGDPLGEITFGVQVGDVQVQTRIHVWSIGRIDPKDTDCPTYSAPVALSGCALASGNPLGVSQPIASERKASADVFPSYLEFCQ